MIDTGKTYVCEHGWTYGELQEILGNRLDEFGHWMRGQTMMLCPDHGTIVYRWDLANFLRGGPVLD